MPFADGERVEILSGYGPNAGSSLHCRAEDSVCANDYYALDFVLSDHAEYGRYQPVLAIADGTVLDAGWGSSGWSNYGQRIYIEHDPGDGHTYTSMVAHLESISVYTGQHVSKGDEIGTLGRSCEGALECGSFSTPHVHFAIQRDSNFGGSGSGGSYGGNAAIPEPVDGYTSIDRYDILISANGAEQQTGPGDCTIDPNGETIIEEDSDCVQITGDSNNIHDGGGHGGHSYLTEADVAEPHYAEGAIWAFDVVVAGEYDVYVYIPSGVGALTTEATYKVQFDGTSDKYYVDQNADQGGWVLLDRISFATGSDQWVRLGDNYNDSADAGRDIVMDALRLIPANPVGDDDDDDDASDDDDDASDDDDDASGDDDEDDDDTFDENFQPHDGGSLGCMCSAAAVAALPSVAAPLLLATALARRRRSTRS